MTPRFRFVVVLVTGIALYYVLAIVQAGEILPAPKACPPQDGYQWNRARRPVDHVMWVQVRTVNQFAKLCAYPDGTLPLACMWRYEGIGIVYAMNAREVYGEALQDHENCHAGWDHLNEPIVHGGLFR